MARRIFVISLLVLLLFTIRVVRDWWSSQPKFPLEAPSSRPSRDAPPRTPDPASADPASRRTGAKEASRENEAVDSASTPDAITLHGTIVAIDEHGEPKPELDGSFQLHFTQAAVAQSREVKVHAGRWTTDVTGADAMAIDGVILGEQLGRGAVEGLAFPPSGELSVHVELIAPSFLRVVDAVTRAPLSAVDLFLDEHWLRGSALHPERSDGKVAPVVTAASSPIRVPPIDGQPVYWIHAEGYAWTRVQVQHLVGGEREVPLVRGGTLDVEFDRTPESPVELVLTREEARWSEPVATQGRVLADFSPGPCDVEVRVGDTQLAKAHAEVRPGDTTRVDLVLPPFTPAVAKPRARFRGHVVGAASMIAELKGARLITETPPKDVLAPEPRVALSPDPKDPRSTPFDFGDVELGRYVVTIEPVQLHARFEIGASGLEDAVIDLPPLCDVEIEVVDGHTGEVLEDGGISWKTADHPLPDRNFPTRVNPDKSRKVTQFLAPAGNIIVQCWPDAYDLVEKELEVRQGRNRATIAVEREQYVRVLLKDGDANVPIDPGRMEFDLLRADGTSAKVGWAKEVTTGALLLVASAPGDYTLKSPPIAGFAAIPDRTVHVEYGGTTDVVLQLGRD